MNLSDYALGIPFQPEATEFSDDLAIGNAELIIRELKRHPEILRPLEEMTHIETGEGRPRMKGSWALVMIGFVLTGEPDVQPFIRQNLSYTSFWEACGFDEPPSYPTAHRRLTELEERADAFWKAAVQVIKHARKHEPRIGKILHADGTPFLTNGRLHHDCPDEAKCRAERRKAGAKVMPSLSYQEEKTYRQSWQDASLEEAEKMDEDSLPDKTETPLPAKGGRYYWFNGHRYWSRDSQAGVRTYRKSTGPYSWHGGILNALSCAFMNSTIVPVVIPASESELRNYPLLIERLKEIMGDEMPDVVSGDKALGYDEVFELNAKLGIETVAPKRKKKNAESIAEGYREDWVDEGNVIRCQHCGGPTTMDGHGLGPYKTRAGRRPSLRVRCEIRLTPDCAKPQSIDRSKSWLQATQLNTTHHLYHAVGVSHGTTEHVHGDVRSRYAASGKTPPQMPKRPGIRWQELRVNAAFLIQWFRICLRHGWLGSHKRINSLSIQYRTAHPQHAKALSERAAAGLELPYGPKARGLGLSPPEPIPPPPDPAE